MKVDMAWYISFHINKITIVPSPGLPMYILYKCAFHYNSFIWYICQTYGQGDVIIRLAQELNTQQIWSGRQLSNQVVLILALSLPLPTL